MHNIIVQMLKEIMIKCWLKKIKKNECYSCSEGLHVKQVPGEMFEKIRKSSTRLITPQ